MEKWEIMSDEELLKEWIKYRNHEAAAELVRRHGGIVYARIYRYKKDWQKVEDLYQEVWFKCFTKADSFRHGSSFSTWLVRITINTCLNDIRSDDKEPDKESDDEVGVEYSPNDDSSTPILIDPHPVPGSSLDSQKLKKLLDSMDEPCRSILILRFLEGRTVEEVADILGLSERTIAYKTVSCFVRLKKDFLQS